MKYTMVKQFSNAALDNAYKFIYKIVDFFKVLYEAFWAFLEIWGTFFGIFINMFLYIYYLLLFIIDRGAEEGGSFAFWRRRSSVVSKAPNISLTRGSNPVPSMYRTSSSSSSTTGSAVKSAVSSAQQVVTTSARFSGTSSGGKIPVFKRAGEALVNFFIAVGRGIVKPFKAIVMFFDRRLKPVKVKTEEQQGGKKSLIEEYLKEYEQGKE